MNYIDAIIKFDKFLYRITHKKPKLVITKSGTDTIYHYGRDKVVISENGITVVYGINAMTEALKQGYKV